MMPKLKSPTRLESLDGMRGLAALVVFLHHAVNIFYPTLGGLWQCRSGDLHQHPYVAAVMHVLPVAWLFNGAFAVSFFFVLSGFVLTLQVNRPQQAPPLHKLLVQRFIRLFPLVLIASCVGWLTFKHNVHELDALTRFSGIHAKEVFDPDLSAHVDLMTLLEQITYGVWHNESARQLFDPVLWSIGAEFQGSVLTYVTLCSTAGVRQPWIRYALGSALLVLFLGPFGVCFVAGMALAARYQARGSIIDEPRVLAVLVPLALLWICINPYNTEAWLRFPWQLTDTWRIASHAVAASILLVAGIQIPRLRALFTARWPRHLGTASYGLYVIHMPILYGLAAPGVLWLARYVSYDAAVAVAGSVGLALSLVAGYALIQYVDVPLNQRAKRWVKAL